MNFVWQDLLCFIKVERVSSAESTSSSTGDTTEVRKKIFFYKTNLLNNISPSLAEPHTRTPPTKVRWRNIVRFTSSWGLFSSDGYGDPVWLSGWNEDREGLFEPKSGSWWCTVAQAVLDKRNTFLYFKRTPFDFLVYIQRRVQRRPVADSTEVKRTKSTNEVNERC